VPERKWILCMRNAVIGFFLLMFSTVFASTQDGAEATVMARAMDAVLAGKWSEATVLADPAGQVGRDIVDWHRLRAGAGQFDEYVEFLERRADWPGLPLMRRLGEGNILGSAPADKVIAYFADLAPQTGGGSWRLAAAYERMDDSESAVAEAVRAWRTMSLSKTQEQRFLAKYSEA